MPAIDKLENSTPSHKPVPNTHGDRFFQHLSDQEYAALLAKIDRAKELAVKMFESYDPSKGQK